MAKFWYWKLKFRHFCLKVMLTRWAKFGSSHCSTIKKDIAAPCGSSGTEPCSVEAVIKIINLYKVNGNM